MKVTKQELEHLVKASINDFKRNKVRTFLTALGIMIGVLSVVLLVALGLGLKNYIQEQFEGLGANLVMIMPGSGIGGEGGGFGGPAGLFGGVEFDEKDVTNLERISEAEYVVPAYLSNALIESIEDEHSGYIMGMSEEIFHRLVEIDSKMDKVFKILTEMETRVKSLEVRVPPPITRGKTVQQILEEEGITYAEYKAQGRGWPERGPGRKV